MNGLVEELNVPTTGRTLTQHRKTAVSFRDVSLFRVFQLALTTLSQVREGDGMGGVRGFWEGFF